MNCKMSESNNIYWSEEDIEARKRIERFIETRAYRQRQRDKGREDTKCRIIKN